MLLFYPCAFIKHLLCAEDFSSKGVTPESPVGATGMQRDSSLQLLVLPHHPSDPAEDGGGGGGGGSPTRKLPAGLGRKGRDPSATCQALSAMWPCPSPLVQMPFPIGTTPSSGGVRLPAVRCSNWPLQEGEQQGACTTTNASSAWSSYCSRITKLFPSEPGLNLRILLNTATGDRAGLAGRATPACPPLSGRCSCAVYIVQPLHCQGSSGRVAYCRCWVSLETDT